MVLKNGPADKTWLGISLTRNRRVQPKLIDQQEQGGSSSQTSSAEDNFGLFANVLHHLLVCVSTGDQFFETAGTSFEFLLLCGLC